MGQLTITIPMIGSTNPTPNVGGQVEVTLPTGESITGTLEKVTSPQIAILTGEGHQTLTINLEQSSNQNDFLTPERSAAACLIGLIVLQSPQDPKKVKPPPHTNIPVIQEIWHEGLVKPYETWDKARNNLLHSVRYFLDKEGTVHYIREAGAKRKTITLDELREIYHTIISRYQSDMTQIIQMPDGRFQVHLGFKLLPFDPTEVGLEPEE